MKGSILIVGAGLAGAVHARGLAEAGLDVVVIDRRAHVAGTAYDEIGPEGIRIHRYGPHLFHTANRAVIDWIGHYAEWVPYEHRVKALLPSGALTPLPINLDTMNAVFGTTLRDEAAARRHLASVAVPIATPANAAEHIVAQIGNELCDLFFRPYSRKMWAVELEDLDVSVVKRLPIRFDRRDSYFSEAEAQLIPKSGYTDFVTNVLDHRRITLSLSTEFDHSMLADVHHCFASIPIDEFYGFREGALPYRSIRFHHRAEPRPITAGVWQDRGETFSVVNFTDDGEFTRETAWHRLPHHQHHDTGRTTFTREEPCDYRDNGYERFYPVKTASGVNDATLQRYKLLAAGHKDHLTFIGRCGTYRYLNMDQVINQSLMSVARWLQRQRLRRA